MLNSTTGFLDKLDKFQIKTGDKMVSFDLVSLFPNVLLMCTIADVINKSTSPPFSKTVIENLLI